MGKNKQKGEIQTVASNASGSIGSGEETGDETTSAPASATQKKVQPTKEEAPKKEKKSKKKSGGDYWDDEFEQDLELLSADTAVPADEGKTSKVAEPTSKQHEKKSANEKPKSTTNVKNPSLPESIPTKSTAQKHEQTQKHHNEKQTAPKKDTASSHVSKPAHSSTDNATDDGAAKTVPKGRAAAVAAIREALEAKKLEDERIKREEEIKQREQDEIARQENEKQQRIDDEKRRKKEKEKEKKEALKRDGKLLSKGEKERRARNADYLEMLKAQGFKLPQGADGVQTDATDKAPKSEKKTKATSEKKANGKEQPSPQEGAQLGSDDNESADEAGWENLLDSDEDDTSNKSSQPLSDTIAKGMSSIALDSTSADMANGTRDKKDVSVPPTQSTSKDDKNAKVDATTVVTPTTVPSKKENRDDLRSPICCVLGHVDTGKTKLLDKMRQTNVQEGEAGGITQQIGATYFPASALLEKIQAVNPNGEFSLNVPGLLIIDTPGHESFTNLRSRGSSLCNIAILVVDIMHGLEPQTIESIQLLRQRKTPFIVALNKIDRLYRWDAKPDTGFLTSFEQQPSNVKTEFDNRYRQIMLAFAEQGLNIELFYRNSDMRRTVSVVPTSAHTGEGLPDLILLVLQLTQTMMTNQLVYLSELQCTVLEVKVIPGLGTTIDVILINGVLREGDRIVVCGLNGPIVTTVRALLTPQAMKELRIKSDYVHHKEVKASLGVKIVAQDLEKAVAGSRLLVSLSDDDIDHLKSEVAKDFTDLFEKIDKAGKGVYVQASTIGSLEALLEFLKQMKIPVSDIAIGPVFKKDVMRASVMVDQAPEYAVILAFDVKVEKEAEDIAKDAGVLIFRADIIYHLFDMFRKHMDEIRSKKRAELASQAVFPCILRIIPTCIFNRSAPIIMGVDIKEGVLKMGTPLCIPSKEHTYLGRVTSIEANHKPVESAKKGQSVAIRIESNDPKMYGRHFDQNDDLYSQISRQSIDVLKDHFREEMGKEDWILIVKMKPIFNIQ